MFFLLLNPEAVVNSSTQSCALFFILARQEPEMTEFPVIPRPNIIITVGWEQNNFQIYEGILFFRKCPLWPEEQMF